MKFIVLIFVVFSPLVASAQVSNWTLEYCIDRAISNNVRVKRSLLNQETARANAQQSVAQLLPSVNASANHSYNFGRNINPVTNTFQESNIQGNQFSLNASLPIFNGLQAQYRIRETKAIHLATMEEIKQTKNDVMLLVTSYYLEVLFQKELLKLARMQLQNSEAKKNQVSKFVDAGISAPGQLMEAQSLIATDELNITNAENNLELSKLNLLQLMLVPTDSIFDLVVQDVQPNETIALENTQEIYTSIGKQIPAVKQSSFLIQSAGYRARIAKSARLPKLFLDGGILSNYAQILGYSNSFGFREQLKNNFGQYVQLRLDVPIFNAWRNRTSIQSAEVERKRAELQATEVQNNVRQEIEKAYLNKKSAYKKFLSSSKKVDAMKENFRMAEHRLSAGAMNLVDFGLIKNQLASAESDFLRAKYEYIFKAKILEFYKDFATPKS